MISDLERFVGLRRIRGYYWDARGHAWIDDGFGNLIWANPAMTRFALGERRYPLLPFTADARALLKKIWRIKLTQGHVAFADAVREAYQTCAPGWATLADVVQMSGDIAEDSIDQIKAEVEAELAQERRT